MNEKIIKEKILALKTPMLIIAWVACGLISMSCITYFAYFSDSYSGLDRIIFDMPGFRQFIFLCLELAAPILFALYITIFHEKKQMGIFMPIIFGVLATPILFNTFNYIKYGFGSVMSILIYLSKLPFAALCIMTMIGYFTGKQNKIFALIGMAVGLFVQFLILINSFVTYYTFTYLFFDFLSIMGYSALFVLLAAFMMISGSDKNASTSASIPTRNPMGSSGLTPQQQALINVNEAYKSGRITEEEYILRRDTILRNIR